MYICNIYIYIYNIYIYNVYIYIYIYIHTYIHANIPELHALKSALKLPHFSGPVPEKKTKKSF